jgi:TPR repeat protein
VRGEKSGVIDGAKALPACLKAVEIAPDVLRLQYQLARAKQASGQGRDAIEDLTGLAAKEYAPAINNLGATYQVGIGVAKDYEKAIGWYERAANQGFVPSMAVLGWMHHSGLGTPKDLSKALGWYRKAAAGGSASAMHNIGFAYHNGWSVEKDPEQAAAWFRKAAEKGFGQAMSMTAWTHQVGQGVPINGKLAIEWYEKAAEIGEVSAFVGMGGLYDTGGSGIARDPDNAAEWLLKALRKGHEGTRQRLIETPETLNPDTRRAIQAALKSQGFDPGPADGVFGKKTRDAIDEAFTAP